MLAQLFLRFAPLSARLRRAHSRSLNSLGESSLTIHGYGCKFDAARRRAFGFASIPAPVQIICKAVGSARCKPPLSGTFRAVSLDDFTQTSRPPDFLKCDVEGAEVEVFRGAQRLLKENRPILLCEMHSAENCSVLLREFVGLGYNCESIDETHILALPLLARPANQ